MTFSVFTHLSKLELLLAALQLSTAPSDTGRSAGDTADLIDLPIWSDAIDGTGFWVGVMLALKVLIAALCALAAGRLLGWISKWRGHEQGGAPRNWSRAIALTELIVFGLGTIISIRWWTLQASALGLFAGLVTLATLAVLFRSALDNAIAGILYSIRGSIRPGDSVELDGVRGTVHQIALTHTQLHGGEGSTFWIPNRHLAQSVLRVGEVKNVAIVLTQLPDHLSSVDVEHIRLRAYFCPYRRARSPVRIQHKSEKRFLELQTWALREGSRTRARVEQWLEATLLELTQSTDHGSNPMVADIQFKSREPS